VVMNNPEPYLVIKSIHEISLKKTLAKMKSFIETNTETDSQRESASGFGGAIRVGKISDELFEKLQTMCQALQSQLQQASSQHSQEQTPLHEKKSKKRSLPSTTTTITSPIKETEDEENKPKKKKNRKSLSQ
jgi:hypothetical protein